MGSNTPGRSGRSATRERGGDYALPDSPSARCWKRFCERRASVALYVGAICTWRAVVVNDLSCGTGKRFDHWDRVGWHRSGASECPHLSHQHGDGTGQTGDRKSTRLNSSHVAISYAVSCLKKKTVV